MMSDQLFKKRKAKRLADLERNYAKKESYDKILIVSEGKKTEPNYFNEIIERYKLSSANVVVDGSCGPSPKTVVKYAIELARQEEEKGKLPFDKVYCVIDKDAHPCYKEAHEIARDTEIKGELIIISSVPSFEFWLLLHFIMTTKSYQGQKNNSTGKQVLHELKRHMQDYNKGMTDVFEQLMDKLPDAIKNAILANKLAAEQQTDMPTTKVHELVEKLINLKK